MLSLLIKKRIISPRQGFKLCQALEFFYDLRNFSATAKNFHFDDEAIESGLITKDKDGFLQNDWSGKRLLVTSGPTLEALDAARLITNRSSGKMGVLLAQAARFRGAKVDLIHGPLQIKASWLDGLKTFPIQNSNEMQQSLAILQPNADAVAMAAAVADIRKKGGAISEKINKRSLLESIKENFEEVPDLLLEIANKRPAGQILLGFAALTGDDTQIKKLAQDKKMSKGCDLLLANPIDRNGQGFEVNANGGFLLGPKGLVEAMPVTSKLVLAHQLLNALIALKPNISQKN